MGLLNGDVLLDQQVSLRNPGTGFKRDLDHLAGDLGRYGQTLHRIQRTNRGEQRLPGTCRNRCSGDDFGWWNKLFSLFDHLPDLQGLDPGQRADDGQQPEDSQKNRFFHIVQILELKD